VKYKSLFKSDKFSAENIPDDELDMEQNRNLEDLKEENIM
jgi:hypothetical protein